MSTTKKYWTRNQLVQKVERDLDLMGEDFISTDEMYGYFEEAIDDVEKTVHDLYEDYFLTQATITLVQGTDLYDLPSNIFAHKIRGIIYRQDTRVYEIKRVKEWRKFMEYGINTAASASSTVEYQYFLQNSIVGEPQILFTPRVVESGAWITVWYLRQANRMDAGSDVLDVPEAANYVLQYVKTRCYEKEGHPNTSKAMMDLQREKEQLEGTLTGMIPDAHNELEPDLSFYQEMN